MVLWLWVPAFAGTTVELVVGLSQHVMAGLVPAIHVFLL